MCSEPTLACPYLLASVLAMFMAALARSLYCSGN
ncbi:MAG: hypothetical protein BWX47_01302 [candidate division Hyd24-12 bacterium ADurb.Bin004]|nr:MAG: hypothetical protein BWX47_01302 [candidate division Hyd24-12 bacterium ADurb.Bin004]